MSRPAHPDNLGSLFEDWWPSEYDQRVVDYLIWPLKSRERYGTNRHCDANRSAQKKRTGRTSSPYKAVDIITSTAPIDLTLLSDESDGDAIGT